MTKRITAILLCGALAAGMLSGCGKSGNNSSSAGSGTSSGSSALADGMIAENTYATGMPIVEEPITLKVAMVAQPAHGDIPNMQFFTELAEESNIQIDWTIIPSATASETVNLMLNTGDLPDIFLGTAILDETKVTTYAAEGLFIPLDDLIENYAPNVVAAFERSPGFLNACTNPEDGKIYSIGRAAERVPKSNSDVLFIYKPWLDALGLPVPTTTDEFADVLRAFKDRDPNGNGKPDEVPFSFTMGNDQNDLHSMFGSFGLCDFVDDTQGHFVVDESGTLVFTANREEYKNAIVWMHQMFAEGLFDQEGLVSKDTKQLIALGNSEDVILGSFVGYDVANYVPAERIDDYIPLAPLIGPDGDQIWSESGWLNGNIGGNGFVITDTNPYPEASIRWINEFFDPDNSVQLFLGPEGVCLEKDANGMYTYLPTPEGMSYNEFRFGNAPVHVPCIILAEDWNTVVEIMDEDVVKTEILEDIYQQYMTNTVPYIKFTATETEYLNTYGTEILEYADNQLFTWLLNGGIEEQWDSYCKKLDNMGVDEFYKIVNTAYQRMA